MIQRIKSFVLREARGHHYKLHANKRTEPLPTQERSDKDSTLAPATQRKLCSGAQYRANLYTEELINIKPTLAPLVDIDEKLPSNEAHDLVRAKYKLENRQDKNARSKKVKLAQSLAEELKEEAIRLQALKENYYNQPYKTLLRQASNSKEAIEKELREIAEIKREGKVFVLPNANRAIFYRIYNTLEHLLLRTKRSKLLEDKDLVALIVYSYSDNLTHLPDYFSESLPEAKTVLAKHLFFDLHSKRSARELEEFASYGMTKHIRAAKLSSILGNLTPEEVVENICRGCTQGDNPLVRTWFLAHPFMWQSKEGEIRAKKAMKWILEYGERVFDRTTCSLDIEKIKKIDWAQTLRKYGLKGMLICCEVANDTLKAIKLGLEELGGKELALKLPDYYVSRNSMWTEKRNGESKLIDDVTDKVIELLKKTNPGLFKKGKLIAKRVKEYSGWRLAYTSVANDALRASGLNVYQALKRQHPYLCGYGRNQLKEWELEYEKWQTEEGKELFKKAVAWNMGDSGLGRFYIENNNLYFTFSTEEFDGWYESVVKAEYKNDIRRFLTRKNLSRGFRVITKDSIDNVIRVLLDMKENEAVPEISIQKSELTREKFKILLAKQGGTFTMSFGKVSDEEQTIILRDEEIRKKELDTSKNQISPGKSITCLIPELSSTVDHPFIDDSIRFIRKGPSLKSYTSSMPECYEIEGTKLEELIRDDNIRSILFKMTDRIVQGQTFNSGELVNLTPVLDSLLFTNPKAEQEGSTLSQDEIRIILHTAKDLLDDISFNPTLQIKEELKIKIEEILAVQKDIREDLGTLSRATKTRRNPSRMLDKLRKISVLDHILAYIAASIVINLAYKRIPHIYREENKNRINLDKLEMAKLISNKIEKDFKLATEYSKKHFLRSIEDLEYIKYKACVLKSRSQNQDDLDLAEALHRIVEARQGTETLIELGSTRTTYERFKRTIEHTLRTLNISKAADLETATMVAYFCTKVQNGSSCERGLLEELPLNFIDTKTEAFDTQLKTMWNLLTTDTIPLK